MDVDITALLDQKNELALQRLQQVYSFLLERARQRGVEVALDAQEAAASTAAQTATPVDEADFVPHVE